ncbi:prohead serine protease [Meinhardsimonia xiamenensis]|uniref:Prohead serine protease n=2 Tax=Meinhardsimonia xiamenensis TaxID=990712 RepID=A0A1G9DZU9_9RHOB|nr:prohead protease/major capsid protein fusion protein [Meinhardsimonia xiamenensis]PRX29011.1 prohead serine protease [Meinhardsimonia xiamenensis]SDK69379.1 prohead serine protease [Meinhardsimonia xiamenensis]
MPRDTVMLPVERRAAEVRRVQGSGGAKEGDVIEVVWTTGARVQRRRFEGWDSVTEYDEELVVEPGAVRLERLDAGAPFLDTHWAGQVHSILGSVVPGSVRLEGGIGVAQVRLTQAEDARPVVRRILEGHVAVSVGYRVHRYEIEKRDGERELWRAVDWEPLEISAVAIPADAGARVRSDEGERAECVLEWRGAAGGAAKSKGTTMKRTEKGAVAAAAVEEPQAVDAGTAEKRSEAQAEKRSEPAEKPAAGADAAAQARRTAAEILRLCERHGLAQSFGADLIERGVALDEARAAILDHLAEAQAEAPRRGEPAPAQARRDDGGYREAMAAALLHRHSPTEFELPSGSREFIGRSLLELARHALERGGVSTRGMGRMELAGAALLGRAGMHSTSDFPLILANVANKTLRQAYTRAARTFTRWARRRTISDFKQVSVTQLSGAPSLVYVPESGEFRYGTISESREVYALLTYGRIIGITRQVLINDDLDAFTRIPAAFGAAAADLESDIVYSILSTNPQMGDGNPLFDAAHGNEGTAAAITEDSLAEAYRKFAAQTGLDGRKISVLPRWLIVPPGSRAVEARKHVTATTPASASDVNAFAGQLEVVEEPRLLPDSGTDPWFLAADAARIDTVEYAYLEGQEGVYTEVRQGFEVDGVEIKARHDFAAKAIDWRGLFRNAGA